MADGLRVESHQVDEVAGNIGPYRQSKTLRCLEGDGVIACVSDVHYVQ
jgi:hypothetical protein